MKKFKRIDNIILHFIERPDGMQDIVATKASDPMVAAVVAATMGRVIKSFPLSTVFEVLEDAAHTGGVNTFVDSGSQRM